MSHRLRGRHPASWAPVGRPTTNYPPATFFDSLLNESQAVLGSAGDAPRTTLLHWAGRLRAEWAYTGREEEKGKAQLGVHVGTDTAPQHGDGMQPQSPSNTA